MGILSTVKHWFNRSPALAPAQVFLELMQRGNAIYAANPDRLARAVTAWNSGHIAELARMVDEYEIRDDVARIGVRKRDAAVARCEHTVLIEEGHEGEERAELHRRVLKEFWSGITVTSAFNRSQRGGIRLLKKQMMGAQSIGWSCHNIVWDTSDPDHLTAKFIHVPLWHFENLTGELRFKPTVNQYYGVPMEPGSWLVHSGDAIGPAVALAACAKHMGLQDWLLFSERAAIPGLLAKTGAQIGSEAWNKLCEMLEAWGRDWKAVTDRDTDITTVSLNGNGTPPMPGLVERMDRAIAALYRGADLSTISKGEGLGASLQGEESDMLEADDCASLAESLHEQVDRYVIRWATGDRVPLAYIWIEPTKRPDIEGRIKVNEHLIAHGAKISMRDELNWFGRTEADESDAKDRAMVAASNAPQNPIQGGLSGFATALANESAFKTALGAFKTASSKPDGQGEASNQPPSQIAKKRPSGERAVIEAFIEQNTPAADAVKKVLADPTPSAFATLLGNLPELMPEDPALAAVIADAMAKEFKKSSLANEAGECRAADPAHCRVHGTIEYKAASPEMVSKFQKELPADISPEEFDSILTTGFSDKDGAGNPVKYGTLLRDHINGEQNKNDREARKKRLGVAVRMVRSAKPIPSKDTTKPAERVYSGIVDGNAYIAVADEHGEMGAMLMVSYRRGKRKEVRNA